MDLAAAKRILQSHSELFIRAYVHGSVAAGTEDAGSDLDLVLVRETQAAFFDRIREVMDLVRELGPVDLLIYTPDEQLGLMQEPGRYFIKDIFSRGYAIEGSQVRGDPVVAPGTE